MFSSVAQIVSNTVDDDHLKSVLIVASGYPATSSRKGKDAGC
jgi:hypothetical protein